jgi:hypothetical protein
VKYKFTKNYIREYPNVIPADLSLKIITQTDLKFFPATTGGGKQSTDEISTIYLNIFKLYIKEFRFFDSMKLESSGYDHVLYMGSQSQEYKDHVDHSQFNKPRILTCSLILNDNYDGGDFRFFEGEYTVPKKAYSAVVFPSNFCFPHSITPVSEGDRHAIITWIH